MQLGGIIHPRVISFCMNFMLGAINSVALERIQIYINIYVFLEIYFLYVDQLLARQIFSCTFSESYI